MSHEIVIFRYLKSITISLFTISIGKDYAHKKIRRGDKMLMKLTISANKMIFVRVPYENCISTNSRSMLIIRRNLMTEDPLIHS